MKLKLNKVNKKIAVIILGIISAIILVINAKWQEKDMSKISVLSLEDKLAATYDQVKSGDEAIDGTEYVTFKAFFLRDINGDGYAEGIKGTCKEIGKEDTLYMELNVLTEGSFKDGKISINGQNFYLQTTIPADNEVQENAIGNNTKEIKLKNIQNGTQKLLTGIVRSGDYTYISTKTAAIGNNINNYSRNDNTVTLTGTYVTKDGEEKNISKTINLTMDWYGIGKTQIASVTQALDNTGIRDEENNEANLEFKVTTMETENELLLEDVTVTLTIPELNGYEPISAMATDSGVTYNYDKETKQLIITRVSDIDENGNITSNCYNSFNSSNRINNFNIKITYPLEAYDTLTSDSVEVKVPIKAQYRGYNNTSGEFKNPYETNIASSVMSITYRKPQGKTYLATVSVGKKLNTPTSRWIVSKSKPLKIYNNLSEEEKDDNYIVAWTMTSGTEDVGKTITLKEKDNLNKENTDAIIKADGTEISLKNITKNIGIYFTNPLNMLKEDGYIKVYNDDTDELLVTFTKDNWKNYSSSNPYMYEYGIDHIRVETSETIENGNISFYNIKQLNDDIITSNYTLEEFNNFKYIKSTLTAYVGGQYLNKDIENALYEAPYSVATMSISKENYLTQEVGNDVKIKIYAEGNESINQIKWINGTFLIKLPQQVADIDIKSVKISDEEVEILSYEKYKEGDNIFVKIITKNETEKTYNIEINADITPDRRAPSGTGEIELYASNQNEKSTVYYYSSQDIYNINNNEGDEDTVNKRAINISFISPNSLLTSEYITDYDDNLDDEISSTCVEIPKDTRKARVNVSLTNNYISTVSEVSVVGRIPFSGNKTVITKKDLESNFTVTMQESGIILPDNLKNEAKIYYSENENATSDLQDVENGWTTEIDFSKVKSYLIDFGTYKFEQGENAIIYYDINIPQDVSYNQTSYSNHGVYFCLDTENGKYKTYTEANKVGIKIVKQYDLELVKYQKDKNNTVAGATYKIQEDGKDDVKTGITDAEGKILFTDLYVDRTYIIKEILTPNDYALNENEVKIIIHENNENLEIEKISGDTKNISINQADFKAHIEVEDQINARISIKKYVKGETTTLANTKFKLTGKGIASSGKILTTNANGEILEVKGLYIGEEYTLTETKATEGYYTNDPIKFKINVNNGNFEIEILSGETKDAKISLINDIIPVGIIEIEDEKIPEFTLNVTKIEKKTIQEDLGNGVIVGENNQNDEVKYLEGARFYLYKAGEKIGEYTTDSNGIIKIEGLYQYEESKGIEQTYVLKEVMPPTGYSKVKDITFYVEEKDGELVLNQVLAEGQNEKEYTVNGQTLNLVVEDLPSFKLIKTDNETGKRLANCKFSIYNVDNGETPATNSKGEILGEEYTVNGRKYYVLTTNANGEITADLPEGIYKVVEVEAADEKYEVLGNTYYIGVGTTREPEKVFSTEGMYSTNSVLINSTYGTSDGGYIVGGYFSGAAQIGDYTLTSEGSYNCGAVIKYSKEGQVEWANSFGGNSSDYIYSVKEISEGEYIAVGMRGYDYQIHRSVGVVIKYDSNGSVVWLKEIGQGIERVEKTQDGGYIICGNFQSDTLTIGNTVFTRNSDTMNSFIIKYDSNDNLEWAKNIEGTSNNTITSIAQMSDGTYIVVGKYGKGTITVGNDILENSNSQYKPFIIKYDSTGNIIYGTDIKDGSLELSDIAETPDEGYIVVGSFKGNTKIGNTTIYSISNSQDGIIIKYDKNGDVKWYRTVGGTRAEYLKSVLATENGGCIAVGSAQSASITAGSYTLSMASGDSNYTDGIVIICDANGEVELAINSGTKCDFNDIGKTTSGDYIVGGSFTSDTLKIGNYVLNREVSYNGVIAKFNYKEETSVEVTKQGTITIRDNPSSNNYSINKMIETQDGGYLAVINGTGRVYIDEYALSLTSNQSYFGVIKYDSEGKVEWVNSINYEIKEISQTADGDYLVLRYGSILRYDSNWNLEWEASTGSLQSGNTITYMALSQDGGCVVAGYFWNSITVGDCTYTSNLRDGILIKYDENGNIEWVKVTKVEGRDNIYIKGITRTTDGGYVAIGSISKSNSDGTFTIDDYKILLEDGCEFAIKFNKNGDVEWITQLQADAGYGQNDTCLATADGGHLEKRSISGTTLSYRNNVLVEGSTRLLALVKYDKNGNVEWANKLPGCSSIIETPDSGCLVAFNFNGVATVENNIFVTKTSTKNSMLVKYNALGEMEWAKQIENSTNLMSIVQKLDGTIIVGGSNYVGNVIVMPSAQEQESIDIENVRKEYKITTDVKAKDGIKGGSISGEDEQPYETVKYGDSNTKEIKMVPDDGYAIASITVNGVDYKFVKEADGSYTMPVFGDIKENKHIVVQYTKIDTTLTINKVDSETGEKLSGAKFKIEKYDERTIPEDAIKNIVDNGVGYAKADYDNEITGTIGELTDNGTYYFVEEDGKYVPTNSKTYQVANGKTAGIQSSTANSYMKVDLSGLSGKYVIVVNAEVSSQTADYGYATISTSTTAPRYNASDGRFIYISGSQVAKDYTSNILEGGNTYYLHLGYYKNYSTDTGDDQIVVNSVKLYGANEINYNFVDVGGKYESTNQGQASTICNSYIPIDLQNCEGKYTLVINAKVSSQNYNDYGYATITNSTDRVAYNNTTGRIFYISGEQGSDYTTVLDGGKIYYLHLGYYKNASGDSGDDKLTVNSVKLELNTSDFYRTDIETNSSGQAIIQLPNYMKYIIKEVKSPDGYALNEEETIIDFKEGGEHEVSIKNERLAHVVIHHYLIDEDGNYTTEKIADDEILEGKVNEQYTAAPNVNIEEYEPEKDQQGNTVIPDNANGTYTIEAATEPIEVIYYYVKKDCKLVVYHYIENSVNAVPLADGKTAQAEVQYGKNGEEYTTSEISKELLDKKYELAVDSKGNTVIEGEPKGEFSQKEQQVIYYYRVKESAGLIVHHVDIDTGKKIAEDEVISGKEYGERYETKTSENIPQNYTYDSKTSNWEGTLTDEVIEVTYYYKADEIEIEDKINKTARTEKITESNQIINYEIAYDTTITNYIGNIKLRMVDTLPYKIDVTKSDIAGGVYSIKDGVPTIIWEDTYAGIDTYENGNYKVQYYKNISLVFVDIDLAAETIENKVSASIITYDTEGNEVTKKTVEDTETIPEEIKGTIIVKYIDINTGEELADKKELTERCKTMYDASADEKDIEDYELVEKPEKTEYTEGTKTVYFKYARKTTYTINYFYDGNTTPEKTESDIDSTQGKIINQEDLQTKIDANNRIGYAVEKITTGTDSKGKLPFVVGIDLENNVINVYYEKANYNYTIEYFLETSKNLDGTINYEMKDSLTEKYSAIYQDVITNEDITIKSINGYKYEKDDIGTGLTISEDPEKNIIRIYYTKETYDYKVEYYYDGVIDDKKTEENKAEYNDVIKSYKDKNISGYVFEKTEPDVYGKGLVITEKPEKNVLKVYYVKKEANVIVRYVDKETGEDIAKPMLIEGKYGDTYKTENKDTINDYYFKEVDGETSGTMGEDTKTIIYYYEKYRKINVEYIDKYSNKKLSDTVTHKGKKDEDYNIGLDKKDIAGYTLIQEPSDSEKIGKYKNENLVFKYIYAKNSQVIAKYLDIESGKVISEQESYKINGYVGKEYTTEKKQISGYSFVKSTENVKGLMTENDIYVVYYYKKESPTSNPENNNVINNGSTEPEKNTNTSDSLSNVEESKSGNNNMVELEKYTENNSIDNAKEYVDDISNPKTGDNIITYFIVFILSVMGIIVTFVVKKQE